MSLVNYLYLLLMDLLLLGVLFMKVLNHICLRRGQKCGEGQVGN
jgi:hypothetical protein